MTLPSREEALEIIQQWKSAHKDEVDLLHLKLAATNASLVYMFKRAQAAEAQLKKARK